MVRVRFAKRARARTVKRRSRALLIAGMTWPVSGVLYVIYDIILAPLNVVAFQRKLNTHPLWAVSVGEDGAYYASAISLEAENQWVIGRSKAVLRPTKPLS